MLLKSQLTHLPTVSSRSRQNEDIDIALDNCTGVAFAEMVNAYLKSQGQDEGKIGVIEVRLSSYVPC